MGRYKLFSDSFGSLMRGYPDSLNLSLLMSCQAIISTAGLCDGQSTLQSVGKWTERGKASQGYTGLEIKDTVKV